MLLRLHGNVSTFVSTEQINNITTAFKTQEFFESFLKNILKKETRLSDSRRFHLIISQSDR
jgi:hypothetical protein